MKAPVTHLSMADCFVLDCDSCFSVFEVGSDRILNGGGGVAALYSLKSLPQQLLSHRSEEELQEDDRAGLAERLVVIPAFRGLHAGRAAIRAGAFLDRREGCRQPLTGSLKTSFGKAGAAGVPVVHKHRGCHRLRMHGCRQAANIPAVAGCQQRQQSNRRVLRGM